MIQHQEHQLVHLDSNLHYKRNHLNLTQLLLKQQYQEHLYNHHYLSHQYYLILQQLN